MAWPTLPLSSEVNLGATCELGIAPAGLKSLHYLGHPIRRGEERPQGPGQTYRGTTQY